MKKPFQISEKAIELIKKHEGIRLNAYVDPVGIWTIGYGHTATAQPGMSITQSQAEALLRQDIKNAENAVNSFITSSINQEQFDALVSFTFNVGTGAFRDSTLKKEINSNPINPKIENEFNRWVYGTVGGKKTVLPGLVKRRKDEAALYFSGQKKNIDIDSRFVFHCPDCNAKLLVHKI